LIGPIQDFQKLVKTWDKYDEKEMRISIATIKRCLENLIKKYLLIKWYVFKLIFSLFFCIFFLFFYRSKLPSELTSSKKTTTAVATTASQKVTKACLS
jgi:hypothetical protein